MGEKAISVTGLKKVFRLPKGNAAAGINLLGYGVWKAGIKRVESGSGGGIVE